MTYLSVCSGIEAATAAWHGLMDPVAFSEIEPFPSAVLSHHYPTVPNLGDMTRFKEWTLARPIDVLVGGTPCQSFSVAGLRRGLDDPRGSLMLVYLALARHHQPRWIVWENVPGVLSSDRGRAFGTFLGALGQLGYGWAYRVLDAQFFGVPQRRRRVFVVGYLGDWRAPAAVLFEPHSLSGNSPPRREAWARVALPVTSRVDRGGEHREAHGNNMIPEVAHAVRTPTGGIDREDMHTLIARSISAHPGGRYDGDTETFVTHSHRADGFDASEDGTGRGTPLVFDTTQITHPENRSNPQPGGMAPSLAKQGHAPAVAFSNTSGDTALGMSKPGVPPITTRNGDPGNVLHGMSVRRLTPRECERLQGFPDDYTLITYRGKPAADGPRYRALGNSMAVPVMSWIGRRLAAMGAA